MAKRVVVVGAGLAGLVASRTLQQQGIETIVVEADRNVGGRIQTDQVDGFLLDRGFQVLLTSYPEAEKAFDYAALKLNRFEPGALVRHEGRFRSFVDPWRRPSSAIATALSPLASFSDKLRLASLRKQVCRGDLESLWEQDQKTTREFLLDWGFSKRILSTFFEPFLSGIFLEEKLETSSRMFEFVFRMFSLGDAALPELGMQALPDQLAKGLPSESVRTSTAVARLGNNEVQLENGETIEADQVVLATKQQQASKLLGQEGKEQSRQVTCVYFAANQAPVDRPILVLNGTGEGPVNNLCVPNLVSKSYAPQGKTLVSVSVIGRSEQTDESLVDDVLSQMKEWYGEQVSGWSLLRVDRIRYALPVNARLTSASLSTSSMTGEEVANSELHSNEVAESETNANPKLEKLIRCGDYLESASIQGALVSGRKAAELAIKRLTSSVEPR